MIAFKRISLLNLSLTTVSASRSPIFTASLWSTLDETSQLILDVHPALFLWTFEDRVHEAASASAGPPTTWEHEPPAGKESSCVALQSLIKSPTSLSDAPPSLSILPGRVPQSCAMKPPTSNYSLILLHSSLVTLPFSPSTVHPLAFSVWHPSFFEFEDSFQKKILHVLLCPTFLPCVGSSALAPSGHVRSPNTFCATRKLSMWSTLLNMSCPPRRAFAPSFQLMFGILHQPHWVLTFLSHCHFNPAPPAPRATIFARSRAPLRAVLLSLHFSTSVHYYLGFGLRSLLSTPHNMSLHSTA